MSAYLLVVPFEQLSSVALLDRARLQYVLTRSVPPEYWDKALNLDPMSRERMAFTRIAKKCILNLRSEEMADTSAALFLTRCALDTMEAGRNSPSSQLFSEDELAILKRESDKARSGSDHEAALLLLSNQLARMQQLYGR